MRAGIHRYGLSRLFHRLVPSSDVATRLAAGHIEVGLHPFDRLHKTDTSGFLYGSDLATGHPQDLFNTAYYGINPSRFDSMLDRWRTGAERPIEEYTFIDLGCGKGRAILMAARHPFRRVMGVELHAGLAKIAERNAGLWRKKGHAKTQICIACGDATAVRLPAGPCLLYLFHPFEAPAVIRLVGHLHAQLIGFDSILDILYFNPDAGSKIEAQTGFQLQWSTSLPLSKEDRVSDPLAHEGDLCNLYRWVHDGDQTP